jgi:hypothetical protein
LPFNATLIGSSSQCGILAKMKLLHRHAIANGLALNRYRFKKISLSKFQKWRNSFFAPGVAALADNRSECR